ncbi:WD40 repeat domain-containing protein [Streptomyces sp. NPDC020681]|uniref:WD40 repeat domain-containing protein n=1 Tax=Streptomyces sp. NPDC020681 TaxID=3365083 RepID=UPI00379DFE74
MNRQLHHQPTHCHGLLIALSEPALTLSRMSDARLLLSSEIPSMTAITDLAVVDAGSGPLVICADSNGHAWTWDPLQDVWQKRPLAYAFAEDPLAAQYPDAENEIDTVAAAVSNGRVVLAAGDDEQAPALWDLESGKLLRGTTYEEPYTGAIAAVRGEGAPRFVTGSQYVGRLQVWEASGQTPPEELPNDQYDITSLATASIDGRSLVAVGGDCIDVWDLTRNEQLASFSPYDGAVQAVSLARLTDRRPIVAAAAEPGELYVWELSEDEDDEDDEPIHDPITGHEDRILAMDTATVGDRLLAVTAAEDESVRIWDLAGAAIGVPLIGHQGSVEAVLATSLRGRQVALSAGRDGRIRVWDLAALL